jgi:hypothetical protein
MDQRGFMRKTPLALAIASLALLPIAAHAEDISYSFVQAAYVNTDVDDFDETLDGYVLGGSFEVAENFFLFASYTDQSTDYFGADIDFSSFTLGGGYAFPLSETMDLVGSIGYVSADADASYEGQSAGADDNGYSLGVGLRMMPLEQLELHGNVTYVDLSDAGDETSLGIGGLWYFVPQFAVGLDAGFADDSNSYGIGVRWDFGRK